MLKERKTSECRKKLQQLTMEGTRKRGRSCKRWRDKVEEDLNEMDIK